MDREASVRGLFAAYLANRKDEVSDMLTEDFTFSSPRDDHIDKAAYFERCWPQPPVFRAIHIERISLEDNEALVRYRADKQDGGAFRNVEVIRFHGDRIASVDVYFGRDA
ncbi:nuclear transport factor 2 family protein [Pararhizobium sp. YC-54]|uniref:nuclear transport factor 2 family protein n=1 Tax=Pararhizobium sp. YC-54 TaxID=2986920 RepID=UPI0021F715EB|nr:nuclear transport factor 2 family protein [Pararhizobium sp. YC-54]MCV9998007.1 nuclear transport factor 2 family protein [Pararhizobium sp. YC-54]